MTEATNTTEECWIHGGPLVTDQHQIADQLRYMMKGNGYQESERPISVRRLTWSHTREHCDVCHRQAVPNTEVTYAPTVCSCFDDPCWETTTAYLCDGCAAVFKDVVTDGDQPS